jgi:hypothetical protein
MKVTKRRGWVTKSIGKVKKKFRWDRYRFFGIALEQARRAARRDRQK